MRAYAQEDHKLRAILNQKEIAGIKTMVAAIYIYIYIYIYSIMHYACSLVFLV